MRSLLWVLLATASVFARAQGDVGLVNLVNGDVSYTPQSGAPARVKAFMKVREGDRFELPTGTQVRIVYFDGARQENWTGPSGFRAGKAESNPLHGRPADVAKLPGNVPARISRVPELMQNAKLGGVQVRGAQSARPVQPEALQEARTTYQTLRAQLPNDDITPELYLFSALNDYQLYEEMVPVVNEMMRKQPENEDVKSLAAWLISRRGSQ
ncbi:MAG: hypothetical protein JO035_08600 [Betaproteobacteria bacterium]|nr:hypothetical protein [Betaproteobacteria bacterium]